MNFQLIFLLRCLWRKVRAHSFLLVFFLWLFSVRLINRSPGVFVFSVSSPFSNGSGLLTLAVHVSLLRSPLLSTLPLLHSFIPISKSSILSSFDALLVSTSDILLTEDCLGLLLNFRVLPVLNSSILVPSQKSTLGSFFLNVSNDAYFRGKR